MIIEDDPDLAHIATKHLTRGDFATVTKFSKAEDAFAHLKRDDVAAPELIYVDLGLPDISGFEVCARLRDLPKTAQVPLLVVSGRDGMDDQARADEVGADSYLIKPFRMKVLVDEVARMVKEAQRSPN